MKEHNEHTITFKHIGVNQLSRDQRRFMMLHEFLETYQPKPFNFEDIIFEKKKRDYLLLI